MNKTLWIIVIIGVVIVGYWLWNSKWDQPGVESVLPEFPEVPEVSGEDSTPVILQDLEQIDLGDIEEQFQNIDAELNNL